MDDRVLQRIAYRAQPTKLAPISWPEGLAPEGSLVEEPHSGPLPAADVLVVTWTAAEGQALADVLTPGIASDTWAAYTHNWDAYEDQLTDRSPARSARCLGYVAQATIGQAKVVAVKSELHLATDGPSAPIVALWQQMVAEANPSLVISTGTAGGIGASTQLGDVFVVGNAKFNCTQEFKAKAWAQERFSGPAPVPGKNASLFASLVAPNAGHLRPVADRNPVLTFGGDVETVDYFAFADTDDSYGVVADDPEAHTEEMDDATLPLALSTLNSPPSWLSIRNASDPQVPSSLGGLEAQKEWASKIYETYGYWTTVGSAIATWAVIADL